MTDKRRRWPRTEIKLCGGTTRTTRRSDVVVVKKILLTHRISTLHVGSVVARWTSIGLRCREQGKKQAGQKECESEKSAIHRLSPIRLANRAWSFGEQRTDSAVENTSGLYKGIRLRGLVQVSLYMLVERISGVTGSKTPGSQGPVSV